MTPLGLLACLLALAVAHPAAHLHPLLHAQGLSHLFFHSPRAKVWLASLFARPPRARAVAIVGLEWGAELAPLADAAFRVYAFEPAAEFLAHARALVARHPRWNVSLVAAAAGNVAHGFLDLRYQNARAAERVPRTVLDRHVREPLAVLSLDIQGDELDVLQGATRLLTEYGVQSLWVEGIACNPKFARVLHMLDPQYLLFDFVPWGKRKGQGVQGDAVPRGRDSFLYHPGRPSALAQFDAWMCERKTEAFEWLQTDILAVRRDALTEDVWNKLASLARHLCDTGEHPADCRLRHLLDQERKDEL